MSELVRTFKCDMSDDMSELMRMGELVRLCESVYLLGWVSELVKEGE